MDCAGPRPPYPCATTQVLSLHEFLHCPGYREAARCRHWEMGKGREMLNTYVALGFASIALFLIGWVTYRYAPAARRNPWFGFNTDWAMETHVNWTPANLLAGQAFTLAAVPPPPPDY